MILVRHGYVVNPGAKTEGVRDILIADGKFALIRSSITEKGALRYAENPKNKVKDKSLSVLDASGLLVTPGLIDTHSHFRDPGFTEKEEISTGAKAAARGGYTTVIMMGNTKPPIDCVEVLTDVLKRGKKTKIHVLSCANVTRGMGGNELTDMKALKKAGAVCFTDDGKPVMEEAVLIEALKNAKAMNIPVSLHEEDPKFVKNPGVNAGGEAAKFLGLTGADRLAESTMVERDTSLAVKLHAPLCIQHISAAESVEIVRKARAKNKKIHAEVAPHHFSLTEEAILTKGTLARCNPPIRLESDRKAILEGLQDGTIDIIATDHAPHTRREKAKEFTKAPSGMTGLETAFSLGLRNLVQPGVLTMSRFIACLTCNPAHFYKLNAGTIKKGAPADLMIADTNASWTVTEDGFKSRSSNSPFIGETLPGVVKYTIAGGEIAYRS